MVGAEAPVCAGHASQRELLVAQGFALPRRRSWLEWGLRGGVDVRLPITLAERTLVYIIEKYYPITSLFTLFFFSEAQLVTHELQSHGRESHTQSGTDVAQQSFMVCSTDGRWKR